LPPNSSKTRPVGLLPVDLPYRRRVGWEAQKLLLRACVSLDAPLGMLWLSFLEHVFDSLGQLRLPVIPVLPALVRFHFQRESVVYWYSM